mmetsp:Transcript_7631/g.17580  ORF Transcript_7631/g.17580 Transcript_7631/m.17580 type:complete len:382 (-) Transcript_7631:59-1204(-)
MEKPQERLGGPWASYHGHRGQEAWPAPVCVVKCELANRADQGNSTASSEYLDDEAVLDAKMTLVAQLIRESTCMTAYTGAGLSRASGIPDYASKAKNSLVSGAKIKSGFDAQPTYAHHVLAALERAGHLKHYVQQNHDGLPQKAGFPQEKINEIHGAWFDPANPVVKFSGSLRGDLFQWMKTMEEEVDLCLCLGTSLSGMNADRMADTPARKSLRGKALGTVIINLQRTPMDDISSVRVWAKLDDAFRLLAQKLDLVVKPTPPVLPHTRDIYNVPYNAAGQHDPSVSMVWDLRRGSEVRISVPEACNAKMKGTMIAKDSEGNFAVHLSDGSRRRMGRWFVVAAVAGRLPQLPLVNIRPEITPVRETKAAGRDKPATRASKQ